MNVMKNQLLFFCIFLTTVCQGQNADKNKSTTSQPSIAIRVSPLLRPVLIDDKTTLVYELHLTNLSNESLWVKKIEVLGSADSAVVSAFEGEGLKHRFYKPGEKSDSAAAFVIRPGSSAVIYVELLIPTGKIPRALVHRLSFSSYGTSSNLIRVIQGASTPLVDKPAVVLGSPLATGPWAAVYSPSWERGHRRVIFTVDGVARIPGRFAVDFVKLDENGQFAASDKNVITNWYGYEADVFAVADGVVVSTRHDFSESSTVSAHTKYPAESATGNYISLKIGDNQYAFYEHLKPNTIRVKPGQAVRKGDVIAKVGFTGQSTGPHLHLHVADSDSPLGAEGIPFVFDQFTVLGSYPDFSAFGSSRWQATRKSKLINQHPAPNDVIQFE